MSRPFVFVLLICCLTAAGLRAQGSDWRVAGAWQGEVQPDPRLPILPWRLQVDALLGGAASIVFVAESPVGEITAHVDWATAADPMAWRLEPKTIKVAALRAWLAPLLTDFSDIEIEGDVTVAGEGTWSDDGTDGALDLSWTAEQWRWTDNDLTIAQPQVTARVQLERSAPTQIEVVASWPSAAFAGISIGAGQLRATRAGEGAWQVETVQVAVWRGQISLAPFSIDPAAPRVDTAVTVEEVSITEFVSFLPEALTSAAGRLSGRFTVSWDVSDGLRPGRGMLRILNTEVARVQLAASPGLLSGQVPARIAILPDWLGPLAKWTAVDNPAYRELEEIEMGQHFLDVKTLEVSLNPDGNGEGLSARVRLIARPEGTKIVDEVDFTVNVSGPLQELIELGLDKRSRIDSGNN